MISFGMPTLIETSTLEECAKLCAESGLDFIELNMNLPQYQLPEIDADYFKSIEKFRDLCENAVGDADIMICIENCDGYEDFQKQAIELLLESHVFALTFDTGHNHGIGGADEEFIMHHLDRLFHIHLHDAKGKKNHLALGTGDVDIAKYLSLAKTQNCRVVLETKTIDGLKQSVEWLKG